MESQIIRDSLLALAGELDLTMGGPSLEVGEGSRRRSLYFKHSRDQQDKFLTMFDDADLLQCYRREVSVVPQQALALSNSQLSLKMAQVIAEKIQLDREAISSEEFINHSFEAILCRLPTAEEVAVCQDYLYRLVNLANSGSVKDDQQLVRARLVHSLINHNDFISIR